jgi:hypothetical protein
MSVCLRLQTEMYIWSHHLTKTVVSLVVISSSFIQVYQYFRVICYPNCHLKPAEGGSKFLQMLVSSYHITRFNNPKEHNFNYHRRENLKTNSRNR